MSLPSNGKVSESHNHNIDVMASIELLAAEKPDNATDSIDNRSFSALKISKNHQASLMLQ